MCIYLCIPTYVRHSLDTVRLGQNTVSRKIHNAKLNSKAARAGLKAQGKPHWAKIEPGVHLGYRKPRGRRGHPGGAGAWVFRAYISAGAYKTETIAIADDLSNSDGVRILDYWEAVELTRRRAAERARGAAGRGAGKVTVRSLCKSYLTFLEGHRKTAADARWRCEALIYPVLGGLSAEKLDLDTLGRWQKDLALSPVRRRGEVQQHSTHDADDAERLRKRKGTVNRVWGVLRGALNYAVKQNKLKNVEWRKLEPFRNVNVARLQFLSLDECRRLINACDTEFRPLVQAALDRASFLRNR